MIGKPQYFTLGEFEPRFIEQTNLYSITITWNQELAHQPARPAPEPDADIRHMQVWLLQADGTCLPQMMGPGFVYSGIYGVIDDDIVYAFNRNPTNEVVGVVLRYRGKLFCSEIKSAKK
jgi:hypothetical protein